MPDLSFIERGNSHAAEVPLRRVTHSADIERHDESFAQRHIGPTEEEIRRMLRTLDFADLDGLIDEAVPAAIRATRPLRLPLPQDEEGALEELRGMAAKNVVCKSYLGAGYYDCILPPVIRRNILENPGWYTAYTPYQAEIAQGRLEALLNFQTMIADLTAMEIANASLLDEATAAAEAMAMARGICRNPDANTFLVSSRCHPQTISVLRTRAEPLGVEVLLCEHESIGFDANVMAILLQYPDTTGAVFDFGDVIARAHAAGAIGIVAADILALTLLKPPGEMGADIVVGSTQRFGVPLGYGGPHAAYLATREEHKRLMPGRLVGVSRDAQGRRAVRLALQTREQHIRRDKATSNICTAQVLLAVIASMYAVYHGPEGLRKIGRRVHQAARLFASAVEAAGFGRLAREFFDTVAIICRTTAEREELLDQAVRRHINLRADGERGIIVAFDEATTETNLADLIDLFTGQRPPGGKMARSLQAGDIGIPAAALRQSSFLSHPVFNSHHTETQMLRYIRQLEARDLSLTTSMIPLGSCTMKLNATSEMLPVSWTEFSRMHPFCPLSQAAGYRLLFEQLEEWLAEITGFAAVSLQPNAGSQGEYAGLLAIRAYHNSQGQGHRNICLIPQSAHGTNPASAVMAGFQVVPVRCLTDGDIDLVDLRAKAAQHREKLACLMVTYPSTHGVFEETIVEVCRLVHSHGGQLYMDGANMNAQVGLCRPGDIGADVCHLNLHKTFCIPHGGGGPGVGPIAVASHLSGFLPRSGYAEEGNGDRVGPVSAAPWGSASILVIPWMYIRMMGAAGLTQATKVAILNANYIAHRLHPFFPVLFRGKTNLVAHECILDLRGWKQTAGVEVEDIAKRLIDYGYHAPTVSWPVPGTMMIEPTESESLEELDRFCEAMIGIHTEIKAVAEGKSDRRDNLLKNAPHTAEALLTKNWTHPYSREEAAYPASWSRLRKFWPVVGRIDNVYGDRNLFCSCPPVESDAPALADL